MSVSGGLTMTARRRSKSGQYCLMSVSPDSFPKPYLDQSGYLPHFQPTHLQPFIIIWYGKVVGVVVGVVVGMGSGGGGDGEWWGLGGMGVLGTGRVLGWGVTRWWRWCMEGLEIE